jgi:DNA-binding PadR family transcriptional regulator
MEVSPTGYVVLGILNWRARTGYEIKQLVDKSTRFFWAASYGQIYPELKRLESQGLVKGQSDPQGGRNRRVYTLTAKGRRELGAWMERPPETFEARNEGLLKLFLATEEPPEGVARQLDALREHSEAVVARLREIEREVLEAAEGEAEATDNLCLRYGIEINDWIAEWCDRQKATLSRRETKRRRAA